MGPILASCLHLGTTIGQVLILASPFPGTQVGTTGMAGIVPIMGPMGMATITMAGTEEAALDIPIIPVMDLV